MSGPAIVLVTTSFPITGNGSEAAGSFVSDLAEELAIHMPVRVVAPGLSSVEQRWSQSIQVFRYAAPTKPLSTLKPWRLNDLVDIVKVLRAGNQATNDAVNSGATAHILALWGLPSGEWARRVACKGRIGYSVWMLGSDVWSLGRLPILRAMLGRVMREAVHAYADGYQLAKDAQRISGTPVAFLPSTRRLDLDTWPSPRAKPPYRLLFLGRWHPNKGVDLLLEALGSLTDEDWSRIECVEIHGGGPLESLVRERVTALGAAGRPVVMGGFLAKDEAELAVVRSDWVLIPSRIESIPLIFSDAMKLARPVISTPVGDLTRLISDSGCGELSEDVSAGMYCHAIRRALFTSAQSFSSAVRNQAASFDLPSIATRIHREATGDVGPEKTRSGT